MRLPMRTIKKFSHTPYQGRSTQWAYADIMEDASLYLGLSTFYQKNRVLRFCFAKRDHTLEQAAEILCRI